MDLQKHTKVGRKAAVLRNFIDRKRKEWKFLRKMCWKDSDIVYIVGSPEYDNLGDSAIYLAQRSFLKAAGISDDHIREITFGEFYIFRKVLGRVLKGHLLIGMGGGNMGNQWINEERLRHFLLKDFPDEKIIIFPQTISFRDDIGSPYTSEHSKEYYDNNPNLVLTARETTSYDTMRAFYPGTRILLVPDIVLFADAEQLGVVPQKREGVLLCFRSDAEKSVDDAVWEKIRRLVEKSGLSCRVTDTCVDYRVTKDTRERAVREKLQEFRGAELVITDRLHGMVFAALTGTPCIVFSNYNHKVKGTYDWIRYLPYIRYAETAEQAESYLPELLQMKDCVYDRTPLLPYFDKLKEVVIESCR